MNNFYYPFGYIPGDPPPPGPLLKEYHDRKGLGQRQLARVLGVSNATIIEWEAGHVSLDMMSKMDIIATVLGLNPDERLTLIFACLPMLDPEVLKKEDEEKRAGLLLEAFRKRKGLTQPQLAELLGISEPTERRWENGTNKISLDINFQRGLGLIDDEDDRLN